MGNPNWQRILEPQNTPVMIEQSGVIKIGAEEWFSAYVKKLI